MVTKELLIMWILSCFLVASVSTVKEAVFPTFVLRSVFVFSVFMLLKPWQTTQSDNAPDQGWARRAST